MEHLDTGSKCPFGFGAEQNGERGFTHAAIPSAMSRDKLPELVKAPIEPGEDALRTGRCLCGAVSFKIKTTADKVFANYDEASRRWTGGVAMTLMVRASNTAFHGWGTIVQYGNSDSQRHCFCRLCGSSLFVRYVQPEAMDGMISLSTGCLDSLDGLALTAETHIDQRPDFFAFEGDRKGLTSDEIRTGFAPAK